MTPEKAAEILDEFLQLENPIETELEKALKTAAEFIRKEPRAKGHWEEKKNIPILGFYEICRMKDSNRLNALFAEDGANIQKGIYRTTSAPTVEQI